MGFWETKLTLKCIRGLVSTTKTTPYHQHAVYTAFMKVDQTDFGDEILTLMKFCQDSETYGVVIGGGGGLKFTIFTKRVHFWARLVHPRAP